MAGSQVITDIEQLQKQRFGYTAVSLTNYDNDLEPQIAAGSKVEIGGALFNFTALESITGWAGIAVSSVVYIKLAVSGTSVTAAFTTSAPTWSTSKQGWYDGLDRYVAKLYKDASGNYTQKRFLMFPQRERITALELETDAVETAKIKDAAINAAKVNFTLSAGSQSIGAGGSWVVPAGIYVAVVTVDDSLQLEVNDGGAWRREFEVWGGGVVISDGTNVRFYAPVATTVYYRKLA